MPGSPYFLANTFSHLLGGLIVTGISVEHPLFDHMGKKPITNLTLLLMFFPLIYFTLNTESGALKYLMFFLLCFLLGQILVGQFTRLKLNSQLSHVLFQTAIIFGTMSVIGLVDKQNMLSWGVYLSAALIALILLHVASLFSPKEKPNSIISNWIRPFIVVLFAFYVGFDIEVLKEHATTVNPDYINESMNLYFDILNLFSNSY